MDGSSTGNSASVPGSNGFLNLGTSPAAGMGLFAGGGSAQQQPADGGQQSLSSFAGANGFGPNPADGGGSSIQQIGAVGGSNPSFDLNDFPSLGGGGPQGQQQQGAVGGLGGSNNGLADALRAQQDMQRQLMMANSAAAQQASAVAVGGVDKSSNLYRLAMASGIPNGAGNFNIATEEFPALGGKGGDGMAPGGPKPGEVGASSSVGGSNGGILDGGTAGNLDYTGLIGSAPQPGSQVRTTGTSAQGSSNQAGQSASSAGGATSSSSASGGTAISGDYGLLGLLSVIRMTDADRNRLALGSDLTVLGLNLNATDGLYSTFGGPFTDKPTKAEPHYQLPMCYYMQPLALKTGHLGKFALETLFYIFYALPKDVLQAYAAQELYAREWRYHAESKLWFKTASPADLAAISGGDRTAAQQRVEYVYFDTSAWERRAYGGSASPAAGFLPEADVRVKFPSGTPS
mmetsp:Transcript_10210/g.23259  ORF Transcript_10210/g.23259 Transcript_10210/m.23259 type:complete len:460 (-) Transcript_10210:65-1444(-)